VEIPAFSTLECRAENRQSLCDLEYTVYASDVKGYSPNPGESGDAKWERNAPVRVLSLDGEMLNKGGRFPRAEQDPIVSICAYSSTSNRPDGKNFIEKVRNPGAGKSTEFKTTGRSNYDDAVAFAVGSVDNISTEKFHISSLPNVPDPPVDSVTHLKRGVESSGAYKKTYVVGIRKWNKWIEDIIAWRKAVGKRRAKRVLKDPDLYDAVAALGERPDGTDPETNWKEVEILKWEALTDEVRKLWPRRAKKDIRNFNEGRSWLDEFAALDYDAREAEFGEIQTRWEMFRPKKRVFAFETEEEMIRGFYKYVQEYDADVVTGYNISSFDLPYFIRRVEVLDIRDESTGKLLSMGRFRDREDKDTIKVSSSKATGERVFHTINVPGRDCYDFMHFVMRDHKLQSYQLAFVAQSFLGDTKNDVPYSAIPSLFRNNRERLNDYCLKDAELVLMLMSYLNNMNFLTALARLIGTIPLERLYVDGKQSQVTPLFF
jgi:DNA polymerase elongation subunit (family B)